MLSETTSQLSLSELCLKLIFFLLFLIPSVIQIVFGSKNIKNCPSNSFIPYWLIIFGLILLFIGIFACIDLNIYIMVFNCVICIWFIIWIVIGSFLMYNIYLSRNVTKNVNKNFQFHTIKKLILKDESKMKDCNSDILLISYISLTLVYSLVIIFLSIFMCKYIFKFIMFVFAFINIQLMTCDFFLFEEN